MTNRRHRTGDDELDELLTDPADRLIARRLRSVRAALPDPDPSFQASLRQRLIEEAWRMKGPRAPWHRRLLAHLAAPRSRMAVAGALAALLVAVGAAALLDRGDRNVHVASPLNNAHAVSLVKPITLTFDQPMDPRSTERAVRIEPATPVSYRWTSPHTLEISPQRGALAPDTRYEVTVQTSARTEDQRPLTQPVTISFVTVSTTPSPTAAPSTSPSPSPSPSASPSPSPSPSPTTSPSPSPSASPSASPSPSTSPSARPPTGG